MKLLDLITDLEENRNELLAESMSKYMQDKFRFLGVRGATRTEIYKKYFPDARKTKTIDWDFVENCWNKEEREFQYVVVYYLKAMQKFLKREDRNKEEITSSDSIFMYTFPFAPFLGFGVALALFLR